MFITCQECNTIFRLDEKLLKPTGSKVRCSLCRHTFIAKPPLSPPVAETAAVAAASVSSLADDTAPVQESLPSDDKPLDGIDLAELDSILADDEFQDEESTSAASDDLVTDLPSEDDILDEIDIDFDAALGNDDAETDELVAEVEEDSDQFDLAMDFEIDDDTIIVDEDVAADLKLDALSLDDETVPGEKETASALAPEDDFAAALDDLDLDLGEDIDAESVVPVDKGQSQDDLDLEDLDFALDEDTPEPSASGEETELNLEDDFDLSLNEPELAAEAAPDVGDSSDLGLDDAFDLELDDLEAEPADESDGEEPELSLGDDLELSLDGPEAEEGLGLEDAEPSGELQEDGLDLSFDDDLDLSLDEPEPPVAQANDSELELDLEAEGASDDMDLSDLDSLLETTGIEAVSDSDGAELDTFQLGDDLDLELESEAPATGKAEAVDDGIEELEFDFDGPSDKEAKVAEGTAVAEDDEIDLSDIEEMLEGDAIQPQPEPVAAVDEDLGFGGGDEIDLAELESAIDDAGSKTSDDEELLEDQELALDEAFEKPGQGGPAAGDSQDDDLELDLSMEVEEEQAEDEESLELELELEDKSVEDSGDTIDLEEDELDLSDLNDLVDDQDQGKEVKESTIESGDIELDFQIEEDEPIEEGATTASITAGQAKRDFAIPDVPAEESAETLAVDDLQTEAKKQRPKKVKKKKSGVLSILILLLLLLALAAGGIYYAVMEMGITIPYVSEYLKPVPKDPNGILNLATMDINSKFIENSQSGRLFVITGKVRNGYSTERSNIKLEGRLYVKGKKLVKTESSYAGIVISDQDLAELPIDEIKKRLNTRPAPQAATGIARPGQNIAFMVVFYELPSADQLDEFAIEPVRSSGKR